jgi:HTH-type transcriptional regulator/antitoxin HigA
MHVITRKRLNEFADKHSEAETALSRWYRIVKKTDFNSFAELRQAFPSADQVGKLTVFNIGGNKIRPDCGDSLQSQEAIYQGSAYARRIRPIQVEGVTMQNLDVQRAANAWSSLSGDIFVPHTEAEYNRIVALLDHLIDEVGEDENHPLASLMEVLSVLIERYEAEHVPELVTRLGNERLD